MLAAVVAAITVVAAMTVVGALVLLYYSAGDREEELAEQPTFQIPPPPPMSLPDDATRIDTPRLTAQMFEDYESSFNRGLTPYGYGARKPEAADLASLGSVNQNFTSPGLLAPNHVMSRSPTLSDAAFGTPEWTEEEGATEIFSAHSIGDMADFAFVEEDAPLPRR